MNIELRDSVRVGLRFAEYDNAYMSSNLSGSVGGTPAYDMLVENGSPSSQ
jgi:hypothetical protein